MAGLLDKKSRFFDYIITNNGREQISRSEIQIKYATLSDASIVYYKDYDLSAQHKSSVTGSEQFYFPFEASFNDNNYITDENKIEKNYNSIFSFDSNNNDFINESKEKILNEYSFSAKIKNKKTLLNKNYVKTNNLDFVISGNFIENYFDFVNENNAQKYPTIKSSLQSVNSLPSISFDRRFETRNNFLKLIPTDQYGENIFNEDDFNNLKEYNNVNKIEVILKSYNKKVNFKSENRNDTIVGLIRSLHENKEVFKKIYELKDITEADSLFFEFFELRNNQKNDIGQFEIDKLHFINAGEVYDNLDGKLKQVYLIGKIINSKKEDDNIKNIFTKNKILGNLDTEFFTTAVGSADDLFNNGINYRSKYFVLSSYYSFVNMFTLVIE